jgi:heavy metal efflux system protein
MTVIEKLVSLSLGHKALVLVVVAIVLVAGLHAFFTIPLDAFPDVTSVQVEIVGTATGWSPLEMERSVTRPVETALRGLPDVVQMRSLTKFGISVVTVVFNDGVDRYFARQLVHERVGDLQESLPEGVALELGPMATAMGEIVQYTLEPGPAAAPEDAERRLTELRTLQDWAVAPLLKGVPGVSEVNSFGGYLKQIVVEVRPERLLKHGLSLQDVVEAVGLNSENAGGNAVERHGEQVIVRGLGLAQSLRDIEAIVLKSEDGTPVTVGDVAEVREDHAVRQGAALKNGRESVGGIVMMLAGENGRDVVDRVLARIREINGNRVLPEGTTLEPFLDRSQIVKKGLDTVTDALFAGSVLALVVLVLFLLDVRSAAVVLVTLPISLLATFWIMKSIGLEANLMSLGGLAISIGMIIDATIIQVENVQRHLCRPASAGTTGEPVLRAVLEVRKPSIFGELIIAITFLPILSLSGLEGKMFRPLAATVSVALGVSLAVSIFVTPVLCALFIRKGPGRTSPVVRAAGRIYLLALSWSLSHKAWVAGAAAGLLAAALVWLPRLGTEFIPIMDEGAFDMDVQMLPGVSLDEAMRNAAAVHGALLRFPELLTVVSRTGQTGIALEARGVDKTGYVGVLKPRSQWTSAQTREELTEKMRLALSDIPGMVFSFSQPIQCRIDELVAGTRAPLVVRLFGDDLGMLKTKGDEIARALSGIRGATDVVVEQASGQPTLDVVADRERIARHGLSVHRVLETLEIAAGGKKAGTFYQGERSFDIVVRTPETDRRTPSDIASLPVACPQGESVPLGQVASVSLSEGPVQIGRQDGQRRIGIELGVKGRDMGGFVSEAKQTLARRVSLPRGTRLEWGGQFENQERAMRRLMVIVPLSVTVILFMLYLTFDSMALALAVFLNLPFALVGGVFALGLSGLYLSVPASIGFIVLFGVAVLNGMVLVSHVAQLRQKGMRIDEAVLKGCEARLRPVLMTASIAVFSLIPLVFASGPGSEIQKPLATVVVGGLITSTLLTLVVLPSIIHWMDRRKQ